MRSKILFKSVIVIAVLAISACKHEHHMDKPSNGDADFSRYISVGNSLTAGVEDGGLYLEGQQNSYPEIVAKQMKAVGGGDFSSPFFNANQENGSGFLKLSGFNNGFPILDTVKTDLAIRGQIQVNPVGTVTLYTKYTGPLNNYGVPQISLADVTSPQYGNFNGFFERMLPGNAPANTTSYLDFVMQKPFTFFSSWLGSNDILLFAVSGGTTPATDKATFAALYNQVGNTLTSKGAKGVLITITDIKKTAFFTTVTLPALLKIAQASVPSATTIFIQTGKNEVRAATAEDLFTLDFVAANKFGVPNAAGKVYGLDPANPVETLYVLDKDECAMVTDFTEAYNATIKAVAAAKGLAVFDAPELLNEITTGDGITVNGIKFNGTYITGNLFSLDGLHLTPRGYALVANGIIKAINQKYSSSIPAVDVSKFRGVKLP